LGYDTQTSTLEVTITHESPAPTVHYVYKVEIEKNEQLIISEEYTSQPTTSTFTYSYIVEANEGDELKAKAFCNIAGTISETLIVPSNEAPSIPEINGPPVGGPNTELFYTFVTTDPEGNDVFYYIDWGDGTNSGWIGPFPSGEEITEIHSWDSRGEYEITAKAKDTDENEGLTGTFDITIPRVRSFETSLLIKIIQNIYDRITFLVKILI
jgi:hypothetical protein